MPVEEQVTYHKKLGFNGMIISFCSHINQTHPQGSFWMHWDDAPRFMAFMDMNGFDQVDNGKVFGLLVGSRIVQVCSGS